MSTMKKTGDLGNVRFAEKPPPSDWPKEKRESMRCREGEEIGAYSAYNHLDLFDLYSIPAHKPILIHERKDDLGTSDGRRDGNSGPGVACGLLRCSEETKRKRLKADNPDWKKEEKEDKKSDEKEEDEGGKRSPLEVLGDWL